ncbi:hypothetical protein ALO69_200003 [Pseudomonas ficuserectae]|nr:hypothetical protein ALO69_200003 [Pseudomonas ficuserectae]
MLDLLIVADSVDFEKVDNFTFKVANFLERDEVVISFKILMIVAYMAVGFYFYNLDSFFVTIVYGFIFNMLIIGMVRWNQFECNDESNDCCCEEDCQCDVCLSEMDEEDLEDTLGKL